MSILGQHIVIIGAGIGGLAAARGKLVPDEEVGPLIEGGEA